MTDFLENPALLMGIPLLVIAVAGLALLLATVFGGWLHPR
jgi:hypothetical protein